MRIAIFGLGYVGTVSAACLAQRGHHVTGVDVDPFKLEQIRRGDSPIVEPGVAELLREGVESGRLVVESDTQKAIAQTDSSLICVGTPSRDNGSLDLRFLERVTQDIGAALADHGGTHVVTYRSTMLPGTMDEHLIPLLEHASGGRQGVDFGVAYNPEFLREGSSVADFNRPSRIVVGASDPRFSAQVMELYEGIDSERVVTDIRSAEMLKYVDNAFHALKIAFANEVGNLAKAFEVDGRRIMEHFCLDNRLNLSPAYLKPGGAFGGSCLPKDLRALTYAARNQDLRVPVLDAILASNQMQKDRAFRLVRDAGNRKVGILGLSFKSGTDDLRESPAVDLAERLIGKGFEISIWDKSVSLASLIGSNRAYIEREIPHIGELLTTDLDGVLADSGTIVVTAREPELDGLPGRLREDQELVDLVDLRGAAEQGSNYRGICW